MRGSTLDAAGSPLGMRSPDVLDRLARRRRRTPSAVVLPRALLERISGEQSGVPEIRSPLDLEIAGGDRVPCPGAR